MKPDGRDDEQRFVNPKMLLRKMSEFLPPPQTDDESWVVSTIHALWAFSDGFIEADALEAGRIEFEATASYGQLAGVMRCAEETAKWRCKQVRDRFGVISWKRTKYGIAAKVNLQSGHPLPVSSQVTNDHSKESSQLTGSSSQVTKAFEIDNEEFESGNEGSESGNGLPPLSLICRSVENNCLLLSDKPQDDKTDSLRSNTKSNTQSLRGFAPEPPSESTQTPNHGGTPRESTASRINKTPPIPSPPVPKSIRPFATEEERDRAYRLAAEFAEIDQMPDLDEVGYHEDCHRCQSLEAPCREHGGKEYRL